MRDYEEKRDFHRMQFNCRVTLREPGGAQVLTAQGRDLSAQGFSFFSDRTFARGTVLELMVSPENAVVRPLHAELQVVRVEPEGDGFLVGAQIRRMLD